jgi:hypothetical protein
LAGTVFLLAGIAGFVPGLTTHYDQLSFAGHESQAKLLGLFQVSVLHNLVHLAFGSGILFARTAAGARSYLIGGGFVYLVLWLVGVIGDLGGLPANTADNWLHLLLGLGLLALSNLRPVRRSSAPGRAAPAR